MSRRRDDLPPGPAEGLGPVCDRFAADWRAGRRPRLEDVLPQADEGDRPALLHALLAVELGQRRRLGESPTAGEYRRRLPAFAAAIDDAFGLSVTGPDGTAVAPTGAPPAAAEVGPGLRVGRYVLEEEIARGGMGAVWRARDTDLGRTLAVKVLLERRHGQAELERRFRAEAQITGQLQHLGIPPVHEVGALPDGCPFFAMKLIKGRTLDDLLAERPSPADDLPRFLGIFAQVCQTLAYAHSRGVIHRDVKPSNVMVGAFGEVQVMDWGLAKVLSDAPSAPAEPADTSTIATVRTGGPGLSSQDGAVLGTPAYMAPEQARGEIALLDERCDVFGLGALLCALLTGEPPYGKGGRGEVLARAARGDLGDARARLEASGADAELVRLARRCLAPERGDRPRHAGDVAQAVDAYLDGVQARLREAERRRAAAEARAEGERRARRLGLGLAASVIALMTVGVVGGVWAQRQRAARAAEVQRLREAAGTALDKARELRQHGRWAEARTVLEQTRDRLGEGELADLRQRLETAAAGLDLVDRLETIRLRRATTALGTRFDDRTADHDYAAAFREQGLAQEGEAAEIVAGGVRASGVRDPLVAALDDWAVVTEDPARRAWLLEIARRADPDRWRDRFRDPKVWPDRAALEALAGELLRDEPLLARQDPQVLAALGTALLATGANAVPLLEAAQSRHPDDFWLNSLLGKAWYDAKQYGAAAGYYRAALAARPSSIAAHTNLGVALYEMRRLDEAIREFRAALELDPRFALGHNNLGIALRARGRLDEAIREFRTAIELDPTGVWAHYNLGVALDDNVQFDEAMREIGTAWRLKNVRTRYRLDIAPADAQKLEEFIRKGQYNWNPKSGEAASHYHMGYFRYTQGQVDQAVTEYRRAIQVAPKSASPHLALGAALLARGQPDDAIGEFRTAISINPKYAWAHYDLGNALRAKGQLEEAAEATRRCLSLLPKEDYDPPPGQPGQLDQLARKQLQQCEELLAVAPELSAVLEGKRQPADDAERLALARLCHAPWQRRYVASCRFYEGAFAHDARLADDLETQPRYGAACAAALAGCGQGKDADQLDAPARARWRQQARAWLRADLAAWTKALDTGQAPARAQVQQVLRHWQTDADLAGVRDRDALAKLPKAERQQWQQLWADVTALLAKAAAAK